MIHQNQIQKIGKATQNYPKFDDGRIDYSNEKVCFVLNCVVVARNEVLLTRRGEDVIAYPNTINGISGFIDRTDIDIEDIARAELNEELRAPIEDITRLVRSEPFIQVDESIKREWHVYAVLVEFNEKFMPITNWENKSAEWFKIVKAKNMELMPGFAQTLEVALGMRET